jgi:DNA-binding PadR family transcriptional regulator
VLSSDKICFYVASDILNKVLAKAVITHSVKLTTGVPRGLLQFIVLRFLSEKTLSGTEIVEEIQCATGGKWKPSSGSIYPLLAHLQDKKYTVESPQINGEMKRYMLTEKGKDFFQEQLRLGKDFFEKMECLAPMLVGGFQFDANHENIFCARDSARKLVETFIEFYSKKDKLTKQDVDEISKILDASNLKLRKIVQRINAANRSEAS